MSVLTLDPLEPDEGRERALWTFAALLVAALHVGLALAYLLLRPVPEGRAEAPAFDVVFTPAVVSEPAPAAQDAPPEPAPVESSTPEPPKEEPVAREAVAQPEPQPEPLPQVVPEPTPEVALAPPEPPRAEELVVPAPPPKPVEATPPAQKPVAVPHAERKPVEKEKVEKKPAPSKPAAAPASRPSRVAAAPNPGEESMGAREGQANWSSQVRANISRAATYPSDGNGASGTATVTVVIDHNGRLVSRRLAGSSGSPTLDRAALAMIERAAPFPRFPPVMRQMQETLNVPLHLRPR